MTINTQTSYVTAQGNGATTVWPFSFLIPTGALVVTRTLIATSDAVVLDPADYTPSGLDNPSGGTITYLMSGAPLTSAYNLTIARDVDYVQETDMENQGGFFAEVIEDALDYLTMQTQQLAATISRSVQVPVGSTIDPVDYLTTVQTAAVDADADATAAAASAAAAAASALAAQTSVGTTYIGGTSTGSANAQAITPMVPTGFTLSKGYRAVFTAGFSNTGPATLAVAGTAATALRKRTPAGLVALEGGEIVNTFLVDTTFDGTFWVLNSNYLMLSAAGALTNLASAATTDLGAVASHNVNVTGTTGITSFGSSANTNNPFYLVTFAAALTITHNATSLIIPGGANKTTAAGDKAFMEYLGSGNWRMLNFMPASGAFGFLKGLKGVQAFTASGTYNPSQGVTAALAFIQGGGGGGGGASTASNAAGGGGGTGALAIALIATPTAGTTVTVGAGGTAGAAAAGTGGTGGQSAVGAITANGGAGGVGDSTGGGGLGGAGSSTTAGATLSVPGANGWPGENTANVSGAGAASLWGGGGSPKVDDGDTGAGAAGVGYGSGGSGALRVASNVAGGAGAAGVVLILEF